MYQSEVSQEQNGQTMSSRPDPLVDVNWLSANLNRVVALDATYFMPADPARSRSVFYEKHIPSARLFEVDAVADLSSPLPHMMPDPATFAEALGRLGIDSDQTEVVVYDRSVNHFSAPRVWFTFVAHGHKRARVLDGGLAAWERAGLPLQSGPSAHEPVHYKVGATPTRIVALGALKAMVEAPTAPAQLVDARSSGRFEATALEPRPGLRGGHMPGARNVPFDQMTGADGLFLPPPAIERRFREAGIEPEIPIVALCGSGLTAAVLALALARVGRDDVSVYDGSWMEWGARADTPVVTGPAFALGAPPR
jgi:thiosulfate/3-mercaptopyruvate sulfurtransferase